MRARAPGRVNLIGEHTDYNGGFVLPCAIGYDTLVTAVRRPDFASSISASFEDARTVQYVTGVLSELRSAGFRIPGMDVQISGSLPLNAGLSSSASLEVAVAFAALALAGAHADRRAIALLTQRAEIEHVGARVGIMDQFAVLFGRHGYAIFLDTKTLEYELLEVPTRAAIVICNSMVKHNVASSEYNTRRAECERCVELLARRFPGVAQLRDITPDELAQGKDLLGPVLYRRALHVVTENERVQQARRALLERDVRAFGGLMNDSHVSLRDLYEVSSPELDILVETAKTLPGCYGARMTGGGFGGCTVNLVEAAQKQRFEQGLLAAYRDRTGVSAQTYDGSPADGAELLNG